MHGILRSPGDCRHGLEVGFAGEVELAQDGDDGRGYDTTGRPQWSVAGLVSARFDETHLMNISRSTCNVTFSLYSLSIFFFTLSSSCCSARQFSSQRKRHAHLLSGIMAIFCSVDDGARIQYVAWV